MTRVSTLTALLAAAALTAAACGNNPQATTVPPPDPMPGVSGGATNTPRTPPAPPNRPPDAPPVPMEPGGIRADPFATMTPDEINEQSPLKPAFFRYDSDELDDVARQVLTENTQVLRQQPTWVVTIEGHCDERGTPEYNLALGDRRALAAKTFLVSLGVPADRIRTVSYGKEFPFDPGHDEGAWSRNRRAQFVVVSNSR
jgi:peptidoglycan-associated lipoprotein